MSKLPPKDWREGHPPIPGLPDLIWTAGLSDIIYHPDGSFTVIQFPNHVVDIWAELGAS